MLVHTVMASPLGKLKLVANDHGLVAVALPGQDAKDESIAVRSHAVLDQAARELSEYFAGKRHRFTIKLELRGTPFQKRVWRALARIPDPVARPPRRSTARCRGSASRSATPSPACS